MTLIMFISQANLVSMMTLTRTLHRGGKMTKEEMKARGLKAWYVKDKKSGKYVSNKSDGSYEFIDEPYVFCMSLDSLHNHLTKQRRAVYRKDGELHTNIISQPLNIDDLEIIEA